MPDTMAGPHDNYPDAPDAPPPEVLTPRLVSRSGLRYCSSVIVGPQNLPDVLRRIHARCKHPDSGLLWFWLFAETDDHRHLDDPEGWRILECQMCGETICFEGAMR